MFPYNLTNSFMNVGWPTDQPFRKQTRKRKIEIFLPIGRQKCELLFGASDVLTHCDWSISLKHVNLLAGLIKNILCLRANG